VSNLVYVADGGIEAFDISDSANPKRLGSLATGGNAQGITAVGTTAYVADGTRYNGSAWVGHLVIINIDNPTNMTIVGECDLGNFATRVAIAGAFTFVADATAGLQTVNITDPQSPLPVGHFDVCGATEGIKVRNNVAFTADGYSGLQILDVTRPLKPTRIGGHAVSGYAWGVDVDGNYAYVAADTGGLAVFEISDLTNPGLAAVSTFSGQVYGVTVRSNFAYVVDGNFEVVSITNPNAPVRIGGCTTSYATRICIDGAKAYCAGLAGIQTIDITDPAHPRVLSSYAPEQQTHGVYAVSNYVFIAYGNDVNSGLQILDASDPSNLKLVGTCLNAWANDVQVIGNYAFLTGHNNAWMVDVRNPADPKLVWNWRGRILPSPVGIEFQNNFLFIAGVDWGLSSIEVPPRFSGVQAGPTTFNFDLEGTPGSNYTIEASVDLKSWVPILTLLLPDTGSIRLGDPQMRSLPQHFFRVREP
jgi:hypothetical protein